MKISRAMPALVAATLLAGLAPVAFAHTSGGGGGHGGGSMGHSFAGHAGGSHVATQHFASRGFGGARPTAFVGAAHAPAAHWSASAAGAGRGLVGRGVAPGFRGRAFGPGFARYGHWNGGYWGGRFWPGVHYGVGFAWFLPVLPLYCSTFWWSGVPYYYYNDIYYTWSPAADGYVATDPPPAGPAPSDGSADSGAAAAPDSDAIASGYPANAAAAGASAPTPGAASDNVFAYPANGQTEDQQAADRAQCDQWAVAQTGAGSSGSPEFRRAVIACFQGRGYSAQ